MNKLTAPFLSAGVSMHSNLEIEELGKVLSREILGGLKLEGLENEIYDEVPAIYVASNVLGLKIVLSGYKGMEEGYYYNFSIAPNLTLKNIEFVECEFGNYLFCLLEEGLKNYPEIVLINHLA